MPKKIRELKALLRSAGWVEIASGGKGSHTKWSHVYVARRITLSGKDGDDAKRYQEKERRPRGCRGIEPMKTNNDDEDAMKSASHYSVIIQWSEEDQVYIVTLPEWGGCHTHGATYEEAAKNAREVLESLIEDEGASGNELPTAHEFMYPGPSGFTYQFPPTYKVRQVKHAIA